MNRDVFLSILAMDSYNRGYGAGLNLGVVSDANGVKIGTATIGQSKGDAAAQSAGFYAIAYNWSHDGISETVVSFRGTDFTTAGITVTRPQELP